MIIILESIISGIITLILTKIILDYIIEKKDEKKKFVKKPFMLYISFFLIGIIFQIISDIFINK
jgi:hypothetical protein